MEKKAHVYKYTCSHKILATCLTAENATVFFKLTSTQSGKMLLRILSLDENLEILASSLLATKNYAFI